MTKQAAAVDAGARPGGPAEGVAARLLAFFDERRRSMPWRRSPDPYRVWVSEVMLQQTRVETVLPYYERWMGRFPTLADLATAPLDDVLVQWQGLGYYSRARNLHAAARVVHERMAGHWPDTADGLRTLPGIGAYTAGAVASIAFGRREPAIDGNARRVLARLFDLERPTPRALRERAAALIPPDRPGDFNQALMELGSTVCTPRAPRCGRCPLTPLCLARARGTERSRPAPRERKPVPEYDVGVAAVVAGGDALLLVRRPGHGRLAGLWSLPCAERRPRESVRAAAARAARAVGVEVRSRAAIPIGVVPHAFSHRFETYHVHRFEVPGLAASERAGTEARAGADGAAGQAVVWADAARLAELALPAAQRRIARLVLG